MVVIVIRSHGIQLLIEKLRKIVPPPLEKDSHGRDILEPYIFSKRDFTDYVFKVSTLIESYPESDLLLIDNMLLKENFNKQVEKSWNMIALRSALLFLKASSDWKKLLRHLTELDKKLVINIVVAIKNEVIRMSPRNSSNPAGENSLVYNLDTLQKLQSPLVKFRFLIGDDNCEQKSGEVAQKIINNWRADRVIKKPFLIETKVEYLRDVLTNGVVETNLTKKIRSGKKSIKFGSILYGFELARQPNYWKEQYDNHIHFYIEIDSDLSIPLKLIPSLILPAVLEQDPAQAFVNSSRRIEHSVSVTSEMIRERRSIITRLIALDLLSDIDLSKNNVRKPDFNRSFRLYGQNTLDAILSNVEDITFTCQHEIFACLHKLGFPSYTIPVIYLDSVVNSTQSATNTPAQSYLNQVINIAYIANKYGYINEQNRLLYEVLLNLEKSPDAKMKWDKLIKKHHTPNMSQIIQALA